MSREEVDKARALFAELAAEMVEPGQRADIPFPTFAAAVAKATGLPFHDASDLIDAAIPRRRGVSQGRGKERIRFKPKDDGNVIHVQRTAPADEFELTRRLIVLTLLDTPTWSAFASHVADDVADRTGLDVADVARLVAEAVPNGAEVLVKRHTGVHQIMNRNGRLSVREACFSEFTRDWRILLPPAAVQIALDDARRYGVAA
ncbi:hypothetical protein GGE65_004694 [Skermanella aerolata]|uniref:hypothetical protein n=1 Tax=Skermanella aerolata TaxID=393310 RepID=UPI003D23E245